MLCRPYIRSMRQATLLLIHRLPGVKATLDRYSHQYQLNQEGSFEDTIPGCGVSLCSRKFGWGGYIPYNKRVH